ncbi:ImmA/IrrE family metallo-endopeptidase [Sphingobium yanoikuyae]|uniref:ImmA/IrrE family metallo-endopeptidase n=1 Tax=Sphingobium yanoikuyae TaxID=13690 RepID=A0A3G2V2F4_SPHYA|nr:ImmA/IrrE family metallo-endopeptidase [Sphingobium yanoikuyae]AYO80718.1 ImmA/IrrE family metallo-endopeptidase [Sphingobium yanoikuyae]
MSALMLNRPNYRRAELEAQRILDEMGVVSPPVNPVEIAKNLGVGVVFVTFTGKSRGISGFFDCEENSIFVNEEEFPLRQTFTVAHELGHSVLHGDWARSSDYQVLWRNPAEQYQDFREKEANAFAASLLMPRDMMDKYWDSLSAQQLSRLFAVSVPAMRNRLSNLYGV